MRIQPGTRNILSRHTTRGLDVDLREFRTLEHQLALSTKPFKPGSSSRPGSTAHDIKNMEGDIQAPLSFDGILYGVILGTWSEQKRNPCTTIWREHFLSACNLVGKSMAHFQDLAETERINQRIRRLYDLSPVGVFVTTMSGRALYFNPALRRLLSGTGKQEEDITKLPVASWYADPERREQFVEKLKADGQVNDFEFLLKYSDGETFTVIMAARLNRQVDAQDPHIEGFILDISNKKAAEASNLRLQQELQKAKHFKAITVLAGGVAHEFNNILQAMMGSAYLGQLKLGPDQEDVSKYLEDIQESGKRASRLCDQMLSYAGKRAMMLKLEEADRCLRQILTMLKSEIDPHIAMSFDLQAENIQAHLDMPSLSEVVNNLVLNAAESLEGQEQGQIMLRTSRRTAAELKAENAMFIRTLIEDTYWVLSVADNGPGIDAESLPHIFEPFFTTKFQGRGLGLSAVSGIVEKFDGNLGVKSTLGAGTEFLLCLPVAASVEVVSGEDPGSVPDESSSVEKGQIWVVDDEPLIGETVMRMLSRGGYEVRTEQDPTRFLSAFSLEEAEKTQCLILDITMPEASGLDVLKTVREHHESLPVLMMSGYDESEQREAFEDLNISGFIHKPFRMEQLMEKLESVLHIPESVSTDSTT